MSVRRSRGARRMAPLSFSGQLLPMMQGSLGPQIVKPAGPFVVGCHETAASERMSTATRA